MMHVIIVGHLVSGVEKIVGPFASETEATEFGHGNGGEDRYVSWGIVHVIPPEIEGSNDANH